MKTLKDIPTLCLRRFSDYASFLMDEDDKDWESFDGQKVISVQLVRKMVIEEIQELRWFIGSESEREYYNAQKQILIYLFDITDEEMRYQ